MKKLYILAGSIVLSFILVTSLSYAPLTLGQVRVFTPSQGGTGIGSAVAGDVGECLSLTDDSPFTYGFAACSGGSGGTGAATTSFAATYPVQLSTSASAITYSLAFGTTTANSWSALNIFDNATSTQFTATDAWITKLRNLTSNGFVKTGSGDGTLSIDTTTYESGLTAGDGLTRTGDDFDCDTASGSVFGCLASADWTTFNNKESALTFTYPLQRTTNTISLAFGTTTSNTWAGTQTFNDLTINGTCTGCGSSAWPWDLGTNYGVSVNSTSTPTWFTAGLHASSTSHFVNASTTNLTADSIFSTNVTSSQVSGNLFIYTANAASGAAGDLDFTTGNGNGTGRGGAFLLSAGSGGATGQGGYVSFSAGNGGATSGAGGSVTFTAGDASAGDSNGGSVQFTAGAKSGSGSDGKFEFYPKSSGTISGNLDFDSVASSDKTFTFPNLSGTLCLLNANCTGTSTAHTWSALQWFTRNASTSQLTATSSVWFTGLTSAVVTADANGLLGEASTQTCTNQFVRAMSALYVATCATVDISSDTNLAVTAPITLIDDTLSLGDVKQYPAFRYATTTAWTSSTTIALGPAALSETWDAVRCFTNTGTLNVNFNDGTNKTNMLNASTTVGTFTLSSNNSFTASEKRYVEIGTPASSPTEISCTITKTISIN